VPRASTTCRFSRTVGSITQASTPSALADLRERLFGGGRGERQHLRAPERVQRRIDALIRRAVRGGKEVMRLVDDEQRRPRRIAAEAVEVELDELRRRADDVPLAAFERVVQRGAFVAVDRAVGAVDPQAERPQARLQGFVLIVGERAQRVEDERLAAVLERAHGGRVLKAQRLAAPGSEHGEGVAARVESLEDSRLRAAQALFTDQGAQDVFAHDRAAIAPHRVRPPRARA
jgi:phage gp37-like protein